MTQALREHWPEYLIEAAGLGLFMISACVFVTLWEHPSSPLREAIPSAALRRIFIGAAMGLTAVAIIYSRWGKRSGAHINPAVTLTFFRLGKIEPWDAMFYVSSQFLGATLGVMLSAVALGGSLEVSQVNFAVTVPGKSGVATAFLAELAISFGLMAVILIATNHHRLARYTGLFAGILVATYIAVEAPVSGMSMNPARSFGSSVVAWLWTAQWIYFTAPPLGMLLAAELYLRVKGAHGVYCAKLHHQNSERCIFRCGYGTEA